jgi:hypothetical protein
MSILKNRTHKTTSDEISSRIELLTEELRVLKTAAVRKTAAKHPDCTVRFTPEGCYTECSGRATHPTVEFICNIRIYSEDDEVFDLLDITPIADNANSSEIHVSKVQSDQMIRGTRIICLTTVSQKYTEDQRQILRGLGKLQLEHTSPLTYETLVC